MLKRVGKVCIWEDDKGCRSNDCTDLQGTDHFKCKKLNESCTTSLNKQCVYMAASCAEYQIEAQCVETSDGLPCLWVKALGNINNPLGQCIQYMRCEDIPLTTDAECKSVFPTCSSDGIKCTPIKKCEDLSSSNCNIGSDGKCMLALKDPTATTKICMVFKQCKDTYYKTHQECQGVSNICTTNGSQCMEISTDCASYTDRSSCFITSNKPSPTNTGNCVWDVKCRSETCSDISGATHQYCNSKMSTCTTNGSKCMTISTCESYTTMTFCNNGYGQTGPCYWTDVTKETGTFCRVKVCKDILPATVFTCQAITQCVYDGTKQVCIKKESSCTSYTDQTACNFGTSDSKTCYWANNICSNVSGCSVITDETKCLSLQGCSYITKNSTSSCVPQDCEIVYEMTNSCKFYQTFTNQFQTCELSSNNECQKTDPSKLQLDNCMINSNYTYTWNNQTRNCTSCQYVETNVTNQNPGEELDPPVDESAQKISMAFIFLAMILE